MSNDIDRRDYLKRIATMSVVGGAAGLSGCTGGGESETSKSKPKNFPMEGSFAVGTGVVPSEGQYNPYNPKRLLISPNNAPNQVLYDMLWQPIPKTNEDYMEKGTLLTGRKYDPNKKKVTLKIREDAKWHNGDTYKAQDLITHYRMEQYVNDALGNIKEFTAPDEKTVEATLKKAVNTEILWNSLHIQGTVKHSQYSEWVQRFQDATTNKETDQVLVELQEWAIEKPVGNGPFQYERANSQELVLKQFEGYHRPVPFTEYVYKYLPDLNSLVSAFLGGDLDGQAHMSIPQSTQKQLPDHIKNIQAGTASGGWNISVNMKHDFLGKRKVRQAIAYLIDRHRMAENTLPAHGYLKHVVGLTNKSAQRWLGDRLDAYNRYQGNNTEKAMALLEEAGYSKQNGTIVDSNGKPVKFEFLTPTWTNPSRIAETTKTTFDDFGLQMEISSQPGTQFSNRQTNGDFDMTIFYWWAPHPYSGYQRDFINRQKKIHNKITISVPPVGEPDGPTSEVDVQALLDQLYTETDTEAAKEIVQKIAWVYNQYLPTLPMTQGVSTSYIATDDWHTVSKDSKHYNPFYPTEWWVRVGELYPTQ